jgi:GDPmannose 4,6-dehydratase
MKKRALITGINGQDGSYLAEFLLDKGYEVFGTVKRNSVSETQTSRIDSVYSRIKENLIYADLNDLSSLIHALKISDPQEVYNLAAQSHVRISFDQPLYTAQTTGIGVLNILEAIRIHNPDIKMYQASSSEMFGNSIDSDGFQRETTPMNPVSPYGCSKVFGYNICRNYRNSYGLFISNGILFNHESPRRGTNFVTNKVCKEAVKIKLGLSDKLHLGNLDATRDWGHAKDYVEAMYLLVQQDVSDDYVISSGEQHSVRDFCDMVADYLGVQIEWRGEGLDEVGIDMKTGQTLIEVSEEFYRPAEVNTLLGDCTKAKQKLNWTPKYSFKDLVHEMCSDEFNKNYY